MSNQSTPLAVPATSVGSGKRVAVALTASLLGWSLDLYDLFTLLFIAPVIGQLFFPSKFPTLSLAAVYASFAVTLLMRPVGSGLFGALADRRGRKRSMTVAMVGVGISAALLGVLPTVDQAGLMAPVLFLFLRLVEGVFVGGVVASTHTISTESIAPRWRGTVSGLIGGGGAGLGALFATLVFYVLSRLFPGPQFTVWGWRVMFYTSLLSSLLAWMVFRYLEESPYWLKVVEQGQTERSAPVRAVFSRRYLPILWVNLCLVIGGGSGYYLTSGFLPTFLGVVKHLSHLVSSQILIWASLTVLLAAVLFGWISDLWGRKKTFLVAGLMALVLLPLSYFKLASAPDAASTTFWALLLVFVGNATYAPILIFLNERYPTALRSTGTALSWNMGFALGGMMPTFVTLAAGKTTAIPLTLSLFVVAIFALYLVGAILSPETRGEFH